MRIADLDTSRGDECPTEWSKITTSDPPSIDVCRTPNDAPGCCSTTYTVNGSSYYKICSRVRGYQKDSADSFRSSQGSHSIDNPYGGSVDHNRQSKATCVELCSRA